jgi:hypothetical protein
MKNAKISDRQISKAKAVKVLKCVPQKFVVTVTYTTTVEAVEVTEEERRKDAERIAEGKLISALDADVVSVKAEPVK